MATNPDLLKPDGYQQFILINTAIWLGFILLMTIATLTYVYWNKRRK